MNQSEKEEVSPLELFFDLVFVFALSQLSHHLLDNLTWRGVTETLVLLVAVFTVWSYTSFEATLLQVSQTQTRWVMLAVMLLGLFMNSSLVAPGRTAHGGSWHRSLSASSGMGSSPPSRLPPGCCVSITRSARLDRRVGSAVVDRGGSRGDHATLVVVSGRSDRPHRHVVRPPRAWSGPA